MGLLHRSDKFLPYIRQARQLKECLNLTQELLRLSARDAALTLQISAQQVRVDLTQKELQRVEATIRYADADNTSYYYSNGKLAHCGMTLGICKTRTRCPRRILWKEQRMP